jgi:hypothetical protein
MANIWKYLQILRITFFKIISISNLRHHPDFYKNHEIRFILLFTVFFNMLTNVGRVKVNEKINKRRENPERSDSLLSTKLFNRSFSFFLLPDSVLFFEIVKTASIETLFNNRVSQDVWPPQNEVLDFRLIAFIHCQKKNELGKN